MWSDIHHCVCLADGLDPAVLEIWDPVVVPGGGAMVYTCRVETRAPIIDGHERYMADLNIHD